MKFKFLIVSIISAFSLQAQTTKAAKINFKEEGIFAAITTNKGLIITSLDYEKTPITVANFVTLAEGKNKQVTKEELKNKPYYDGLKFHRVIADFMIQGGDPLGTGAGDPGYKFKDEFVPELNFDKAGVLAMANSGPRTNGSQFFITHKDTPWLDQKHTIFGQVVQGMDVVNAIAQNDTIKQITILRNGKLAKKFDAVKVFDDYFANKAEDDKKQDLIDAANKKVSDSIAAVNRKKQEDNAKQQREIYLTKYAPLFEAKKEYFDGFKTKATTTESGLQYYLVNKGSGEMPADGTTVYFHYAGYLTDGQMFDSSYEELSQLYGMYNERRAKQNGYSQFPYEKGSKKNMIPGFIEAIENLGYGDKMIAYIPAALAYGDKGAGGVIPPNSDIIFEIELFKEKTMPDTKEAKE
jgi:peptidyl-prolyl cis-trans isomerase A (cyclophilin A)